MSLLPYSPEIWDKICFDILGDGSIDTESGPLIEPTCDNAGCVLDAMPNGTRFGLIVRLVPDAANPATAIQFTDRSLQKRLSAERDLYPCLWYRVDPTTPQNDWPSYDRLASYGRLEILDGFARNRIEAVVLVTPENLPLPPQEAPALQRRA